MMGYANSLEDLAKGDELKGILHTGDVGYKDEDGDFYITGRLKRFIKIFGNRISLDEIEHFLKSNSIDAICVGIDNKLMVATKEDNLELIKKMIVKNYKFHPSVVNVKKFEEYPISDSGKIEYQKILKMFNV
jgi:long-chain acyl-CoA synthetase